MWRHGRIENINRATARSWGRRLLSASDFPILATAIVRGLVRRDLRAALRVLLIDLHSICEDR